MALVLSKLIGKLRLAKLVIKNYDRLYFKSSALSSLEFDYTLGKDGYRKDMVVVAITLNLDGSENRVVLFK